jgi:uncharacterized protein (TIGR02466 family)
VSSFHAFATKIYHAPLLRRAAVRKLNEQLFKEAEDISSLDPAGQAWSKKNYRNGYTSFASVNELQKISPTFAQLESAINPHVEKYTRALDFDLGGKALRMTNCWLNVMEKNTHHGMHLHPLSVVSGTYYLQMPEGASAIKFEDPRLGLFMGSPPKKPKSRPENKTFFEVPAMAGELVLFESWLRHEVPLYSGREPRISISFNYGWGE